jgi:hypothetical protein
MPIMSEGTGDEENVIGYCLTFTCFRVTFQVFIPFVTGDLAPLEDFHGSVVQIWPPLVKSVDWPPSHRFDDTSVAALSRRIYNNRKPVVRKCHSSR